MTGPEIPPSNDDDLFSEGIVISSADVPLSPQPTPASPSYIVTADEDGSLNIEDENELEPGQRKITPPDEYDRENATVAPDGTPLTENQIRNPHIWRAGDKRKKGRSGGKKANRINVREIVDRLSSKTMLDPIEVLFYIMNANEESRHALGLKKSDRISANLRAKCATELLTYMAPKLKSVEVKSKGDKDSGGVQIFLPGNTREHGKLAQQPAVVLPQKNGMTIPLSPELAAQLIDQEDDEEQEDWMEDD